MPTRLTTHVLDTAAGSPAEGVRIQLFGVEQLLTEASTNSDGRCDEPLLENVPERGEYSLRFHIGDFFRRRGVPSPFLDVVRVDFQMEASESYHVPLICSPWSYTTYRGS
ncbi:MAG: hydroxyisourate hydrolase [Verrucomicrobiota bacterium]